MTWIKGATDVHRPTRRYLGFLAFSHGWTWAFWTVAALSGESVWELPAVLLYIGGIGVPLGGIVMMWVTSGRGGLEELGRRIIDPTHARPSAGGP